MSFTTPQDATWKEPERLRIDRLASLPDEALFSASDIAQLASRSRSSIWRDVNDGRLPKGIRIGKNSIRWRAADVRRYLEGWIGQ